VLARRIPNPPASAPDHATLLNAAEKRLITEWMDLGGQYFNNVSASGSPVRTATALSRGAFDANVYPIIKANCVICHQPTGNAARRRPGSRTFANRYILTGDAEGDYNVTLDDGFKRLQPRHRRIERLAAAAVDAPHPPALSARRALYCQRAAPVTTRSRRGSARGAARHDRGRRRGPS